MSRSEKLSNVKCGEVSASLKKLPVETWLDVLYYISESTTTLYGNRITISNPIFEARSIRLSKEEKKKEKRNLHYLEFILVEMKG